MRIWNIADPNERKISFEPRVAEMFGVQGRSETQHYTAINADPKIYAKVNVCDYCAFGVKIVKRAAPLCSFAHIACKPEEREDGRQVIFRIW